MTFVSGLADATPPPAPDPRGYARLLAIREHCEAELAALAPLLVRRFDGTWHEVAARDRAVADAFLDTKRLIAAILSDRAFCLDMSRMLAQQGRAS